MTETLEQPIPATLIEPAKPNQNIQMVGEPIRPSLIVRSLTFIAIVFPLIGVVAAPFFVWGWGFGWTDLGLFIGSYVVTALGITVGYHRLFVHRSFETYGWVKFLFAVFGSMAIQGPLFKWAAMHRRHHQHSDTPHDPHTPHQSGTGIWGMIKGFWNAHIAWLFSADPPQLWKYVKDLNASKSLRVASALFPLWAVISIALPGVLGGLITMSWTGVWTGLIWGSAVRIFLVHHVTWSVNSACHLWGRQPFASDDNSRNNFLVGVLAMGEGWHNSHHAFPTSARHGLRWWQIDVSWYTIRAMKLLGLAWDVKVPSKEQQVKNRRKREAAAK